MRILRILYCADSPGLKKEAEEMAKFLREHLHKISGIFCMVILHGFHYNQGEATDRIVDAACITPLIDKPIIPARQPMDAFVKGLGGVKKHIRLIEEYVSQDFGKYIRSQVYKKYVRSC